jgi:isopentenyl diphosphate isomerase/L-lactate dehydrogenase-like FMN-dependent dehydrogenase
VRSNHGGRQLDGAIASMIALPGIVAAVESRAPVMIDGGFRRGVDVIKALALGARAVLIGRSRLWGLARGGEDGVLWALELYRREIDRALALGGADGVAKLDPGIFSPPIRRRRARATPAAFRGMREDILSAERSGKAALEAVVGKPAWLSRIWGVFVVG